MFIALYVLMALALFSAFLIYKLTKSKSRAIPIDDVGVFTVLCLCLYTLLPVFSWLLQGGQYIVPSGRLYEMQPTVNEVYELTLLGVAPIFGVLAVYALQRNTLAKLSVNPKLGYKWWISKKLLFICLFIYICAYIFEFGLEVTFGVLNAESYTDTYAKYASLPGAVGQLLQLTGSALSLSMVVVVTAIIMRWNAGGKKWFIMISLVALFTFEAGHSRTELFFFILLSTLVHHMFVHPITSASKAIFLFLLALVGFLLLGIRGDGLLNFVALPLGEFDILWGNAVHLLRERNEGSLSVPLAAYLNEFVIFVPSQFLPYEKMDLPNWYLDTYYPEFKASGGGLMFGSISRAIIGFGVTESFLRGVVLGVLSVKLKKNMHKSNSCWSLVLFLLIYMGCYSFVRLGNFSSVVGLLGLTLLVVVVIRFLNSVLPSKRRPHVAGI